MKKKGRATNRIVIFAIATGIASISSSSQALVLMGVDLLWQIPVLLGVGYLIFLMGKQMKAICQK